MTDEEFKAQSAIDKLSHVLQANHDDLQFLTSVGVEKINELYLLVTERLQYDPSPLWERLAKVTGFIPNFINARVASDILGPHITANLTYHVPVKAALSIARYFSPDFMAEVSEQLVPSRAVELLRAFPVADMKKVTKVLLKNEKYYTMGTFVDVLPVKALHEIAREIHEEAHLLRIASYASNKAHLAEMLEGFTDERILRMVHAANELTLWGEVTGIVSHFSDDMRKRMASLIPQFSDDELISMIRSACSLTIPQDIVITARYLDDEQKKRLASFIPLLSDSEVLALVRAAHQTQSQDQILLVAQHLDEQEKRRFALLLAQLYDEELLSLVGSSFSVGLATITLEIVSYVPESEIPRIRDLISKMSQQDSSISVIEHFQKLIS